jgi:molecular chaperone GrpE (heat shock protein)
MSDPADTVTLEALAGQVNTLRDFVERQHERDALQRKAFDQLYEELRQYKDDFVFQAEKPLLLDLLLFYDSLSWFHQSLQRQEMSPEVVSDSFQYLLDEFLELLYRRDVLPTEPRESFDRESQKAVKVALTSDPGLDYKVQQVVKRGFSRAGRLLRPEEVVLHRYSAEVHTPEASRTDGRNT